MVRRAWVAASVLVLLLLAAAGGGLAWLVGTTDGARWALGAIDRWSPLGLECRQVEGRLAGELDLRGMLARWPGGQVRGERVHLTWVPSKLLQGTLQVEALHLGGIDIEQFPGETKPGRPTEEGGDLAWPKLDGWPLRLKARLGSLELAGLRVQRPGSEPVCIERLSIAARFEDGELTLSQVVVEAPQGLLEASLWSSFVEPGLRLEAAAKLAVPRAEVERVGVTLALGPASAPAVVAGPLSVQVDGGGRRVSLAGDLELGHERLQLGNLVVSRPGRPDRVEGQGALSLGEAPSFHLELGLQRIDLADYLGVATDLSGAVTLSGMVDGYEGALELENAAEGVLGAALKATVAGDRSQVRVKGVEGRWLEGTLAGEGRLAWGDGLAAAASIRAQGLNPAVGDPRLSGRLNLDVRGTLARRPEGPLDLQVEGALDESRLQGHPLSGEFDVRLVGKDLEVARLSLLGDGIRLAGAGKLAERLTLSADIAGLDRLAPQLQGQLRGGGWLRWRGGLPSGELHFQGTALGAPGIRSERLDLALRRASEDGPLAVTGSFEGLSAGPLLLDRADLAAEGTQEAHSLALKARWQGGTAEATVAGSLDGGRWEGVLASAQGQDERYGAWHMEAPAALEYGPKGGGLAPLALVSDLGERLEARAQLSDGGEGRGRLEWDGLNLSRFKIWLPQAQPRGTSSGSLAWQRLGGEDHLQLHGLMAGQFNWGHRDLVLSEFRSDLEWGRAGLEGKIEASLGDGSSLQMEVAAADPPEQGIPQAGQLAIQWRRLDLGYLSAVLPQGLEFDGRLAGQIAGQWRPGYRVDLDGMTDISGGVLRWRDEAGVVEAALEQAELKCGWHKDRLVGRLLLELGGHGEVGGRFDLPLAGGLPPRFDPDGPLEAGVKLRLAEKGLVAALLPGVVQETAGRLEGELALSGSQKAPRLSGEVQLAGGGAYFPAAGIQLADIGVLARVNDNRVDLEALSLRSGAGALEGRGTVTFEGWVPVDYEGRLRGEFFEAVSLPEVRLLVSPDLAVEGTGERLKLRGEVTVPEMLVRGRQAKAPVTSSPDVVFVDAPAAEAAPKEPPIELDAEVHVVFGDHVLVKTAGVDARLGGAVTLQASGGGPVTANGEVRVEKGTYAAYGMRLDIERGKALFAGGRADRPVLDILALRQAGEVKAGVKVSGTPQKPQVHLYSEPHMPDTDILAYVVLGRPFGAGGGDGDLMMVAAGALLAGGESAVLQDRLQRRLGLDVIEIQAGGGEVSSSVVTIGKYLSPKLYVSLGHALFSNTNEFQVRYSLDDHWQLESNVGVESGVDLFYQVRFD